MVMNQSALLHQPTAMCNRNHQNVVLISRQQKPKKRKAEERKKADFNVFLLASVYCEEEKQPTVGNMKKPTVQLANVQLEEWWG